MEIATPAPAIAGPPAAVTPSAAAARKAPFPRPRPSGVAAEAAPEGMPTSDVSTTGSTRPATLPATKAPTASPPSATAAAPLPPPAADDVAGFRTDLEALKPEELKRTPRPGVPTTLSQAVLRAVSDNALIRASEGGAADALASIGVASSALYPQIDGEIAAGPAVTGDWTAPKSPGNPFYSGKQTYGAARGDVSLAGRQLIYDFGATRSNVAKSAAITESQNFLVLATVEDIAYRTSDSYLRVQQQRELVSLADENVRALQEIATLVTESQRNGNGTVADVKRANGRLVEAATIRSDEQLALKIATDQLRRMIRAVPGPLRTAPTLSRMIPLTETAALAEAVRTSPRLLTYRASIKSREAEIAYLRGSAKPRLSAVLSGSGRNYLAVNDKTQVDGSALLSLSYRFADGGLISSQVEQVKARMLQDEMRMRDETETIETDLRQQYFTVKISRDRMQSLAEGVDLNEKARTLYREQFGGGRRTLLELLEVQQAYYQARRSQIGNMFEERRAILQVLRAMGRLAVTVIRSGA